VLNCEEIRPCFNIITLTRHKTWRTHANPWLQIADGDKTSEMKSSRATNRISMEQNSDVSGTVSAIRPQEPSLHLVEILYSLRILFLYN